MPTAIKLSDQLIAAAKPVAAAMRRSVPKQIEYWAMIGKAATENPDLPVPFIVDLMVSLEEEKAGLATGEYTFG